MVLELIFLIITFKAYSYGVGFFLSVICDVYAK